MTTEELHAKALELSGAIRWTPWLRLRRIAGESVRRLFNIPLSRTGSLYRRSSVLADIVEGDRVAVLRSREFWASMQGCWCSYGPSCQSNDSDLCGYAEYVVHLGLESVRDIPILSPGALRHELERRLEDWPADPFRWYVRYAEHSTENLVEATTEED